MTDLAKRLAALSPEKRGILLKQLKKKQEEQTQALIVPQKRESNELPLSFAQERFWLLEQLDRKSGIYMPVALRLYGHVVVAAFQRSFEALTQRHKILRTTFRELDGHPVQVIATSQYIQLPVIDLSSIDSKRRDDIALYLAQQEARHPFDLTTGPLLRASLLRLAEQDHVLLLTLHHILSDGWSQGLLVRDLSALYRSEITGKPASLPTLPIQYADYALWQRQWLQGSVLQKHLDYWQQQLMEVPELLNLPLDYPRPELQTYEGKRLYWQVSPTLTEQLKQLSQREQATLFMTLLASWQILLMRYSGQQDFATGTFIANRTRSEFKNLIGVFVNTLVLRADLTGNPSFLQLLARVRKVAVEAYAHQDVPFEKLLETLPIERSLSHSALFQVLFTFQNHPHTALELPELSWKPLDREIQTARFDLIVEASEQNDQLLISLEYNTALFETSTIQRMITHWQVLLEAIVIQPERSIEQLPLMAPTEVKALLARSSTTIAHKQPEHCIQQIFEQQVEQTPDAIAIVGEELALTYAEVNRRANQLAHYFRQRGVGPDTCVGVAMERCPELIVAMLAILKAGGAYLPLDPSYPAERLALMLAEADPLIVLTQSHLEAYLSVHRTPCLCLNTAWERWSDEPLGNPPIRTMPQHLAYMIYTSGSTGTPKGVMISHANVVRLLSQTQEWFHFTPQDTWTFFHSYAFDFSVWEIWGSLLTGGRLIIVPYGVSREPGTFYQLLCQAGVTILNQTPSAFQQLSQAEARETSASQLALRMIIFGGEALELTRLAPWMTRHNDQQPQLINMYGITETTVHVTYRPITRQDIAENPGSVIGSVIPDLHCYVLDEQQQLVPIGVPGELYVGGQGLARGYWRRPETTAERFIPHPFSLVPGERLYRTGDRARLLASGELEYLGRNDQQVKLRGFRIELGEIAAIIQNLAAVREALVVLRKESNEQKYLVAYVIPQNTGEAITIAQLQTHVRTHMPEYMVPTYFVFLETWPLTLNGKVNYKALPAPKEQHLSHRTQYIAPQTPLQEELALMWADLLHTSHVGIQDHFFEVGGNSLLAVQLLNRMHQHLGTTLSFVSLFHAPTIEQQAELLQSQRQHTCSWTPLVTIQQAGQKAPFFCVHPVIGTVYSYVRLAHALRTDRPFYGLQARGFYSDQTPYTTVEEMATAYVEALKKVQPEGPYFLGGHSSGGMIAYEMARQLQAQGEVVACLALLDSVPWQESNTESTPLTPIVPDNATHARAVIEYLELFSGYRDQPITLTYEQLCDLQPEDQLKTTLKQLKAANQLAQSMNLDEFLHFMQVLITNHESYRRYQPGIYHGQITLLRCEQTSNDYQARWAPYITQPMEEYTVPGNHFSMLTEPHISRLASWLQHCLDEADAGV